MDKLTQLFKTLSDKNRLRIVAALTEYDELCACQITEFLQVAGSTSSRHLGLLLSAGIVESQKKGRWVCYRLKASRDAFSVVMEWVKGELAKSEEIKKDMKSLKRIMACDTEEICQRQRNHRNYHE